MTANTVEILGQLGFAPGDGCLTRTISGALGSSVAEIRDAETSGAPGPETTKFAMVLINPDAAADIKGAGRLELRDAALADIVALAIADHNESVVQAGDRPADDLTFADDSMSYHNPFADPVFDWTADLDRDQNVFVLRNPELQYGQLYLDWRASIMSKAESGDLGRLLAANSLTPRI
jgi:hypothetical protein